MLKQISIFQKLAHFLDLIIDERNLKKVILFFALLISVPVVYIIYVIILSNQGRVLDTSQSLFNFVVCWTIVSGVLGAGLVACLARVK